MSDQKDDGLPIGDASNLPGMENEPAPRLERQPMPVPVAVQDVSPDGEILRAADPTAPPAAVMPGELIRGVTSKELQADAKRFFEPCPSCQFFHFPDHSSREYREICAMVSSYFSTLPEWQLAAVPGRNPDEYGICAGAPHGKRILCHMANSCDCFKKAPNN